MVIYYSICWKGGVVVRQGIYLDMRTERYILRNCSAQPGELQVFYLFGKEYILGEEHYYVIKGRDGSGK